MTLASSKCIPQTDILETLGEGAAGKIYKVRYDDGLYALKTLKKGNLRGVDLVEMDILVRARHPNVVGAKKIFFSPGECTVCIVMELASTDLFDYLYDQPKAKAKAKAKAPSTVTKKQIDIFYKLLCALSYLHSNYIVHRDLKPENILMMGEEPKIADFGLSTIYPSDSLPGVKVGTLVYMAPEMLLGCPTYSSKVDVWSLGITFYYLVTKKELIDADYATDAIQQIIDKIGDIPRGMKRCYPGGWDFEDPELPRKDYLAAISAPWSDMIRDMLEIDPEARPSALEILRTYFPDRVDEERCHHSTHIENLPFTIKLKEPYASKRSGYLRAFYEQYMDPNDEGEVKLFFLGVDIADRFFTLDGNVGEDELESYVLECFRIAASMYTEESEGNEKVRCRIVGALDFRLFRPTLDVRFPGVDPARLAYAVIRSPSPDRID